MDKAKLKRYLPNKKRIKRIDERIQELQEKDVDIVAGKVKGSSKDFPYIEVRTSVQMEDPEEARKIDLQIAKKKMEKKKLQKEIIEVEEFIEDIEDPFTKEVFELAFIDGEKQEEIGERTGYSRGRISQIISGYLKD